MLAGEIFNFLESTADAAFAVSEVGEIRSWNRAAEELFGFRSGDAIGKLCHEVLKACGSLGTPACVGRCSVQQQIASGQRVRDFDLEVSTATGNRLWINVSTLLLKDPRHAETLIIHLARDISERKRKEQILARFAETARQMADAADEARHAVPVSPLSEHETRILRLFADGRNSSAVAQTLSITLPTLRNHIHKINEKLRTHSRLEAVLHALRRRLI